MKSQSYLLLPLLIVVFAALATTSRADSWIRGVSGGMVPFENLPTAKFILDVVSDGPDEGLRGYCSFNNAMPALFAIDGTRAQDGTFFPNVVAEVSDDEKTWIPLKKLAESGKAETITIAAYERKRDLAVNLEGFRNFIEKAKYGRVLLKTGEAAVFELNALAPRRD